MPRLVGGWKAAARFPLVQDRMSAIGKVVEGKRVLDCGPGGEEIAPGERWWQEVFLHAKVAALARECIGIDSDVNTTETLRGMGYDIRVGDVERLSLGRKFDVVVAGELIEHLSNPGLFLECVRAHLETDGKLVLTTPNAWALGNIVRGLFGRKLLINKGHVAWYDHVMLTQLLDRHGFRIDEFYWHQRVFRGPYRIVRWVPSWSLNVIVVASPRVDL